MQQQGVDLHEGVGAQQAGQQKRALFALALLEQAFQAGEALCLKPVAVPDLWHDVDDDVAPTNRMWDPGENWEFGSDSGDYYQPWGGPTESPYDTGYGSTWRGPDRDWDEPVTSCTILTTSANETMEKIHDRMPVILPPSAYDQWLDRDDDDVETLGKLLIPAPPSLLTMHTVATDVNKVQNKGPELIEHVDPSSGDAQGSLL